MFSRKTKPTNAPGYPDTNASKVKRRKDGSFVSFVLVNGTNAFHIPDLAQFKKVSLNPAEGGAFKIVGVSREGSETDLASFGSEDAGKNGYSALMAAHCGISLPRMGFVAKTGIALVSAWFLIGLIPIPDQTAVAQTNVADRPAIQQEAVGQGAPNAAAAAPTLDDLANGAYQFNVPKPKMPDVQISGLNCPPTGSTN